MSGNFRSRRPASPQPGHQHPTPSSRAKNVLDADERREQASLTGGYVPSRKGQAPGGIKLQSGELKLLAGLVLLACAVRLFRLSRPNSVVFDEVHFGKFAGRYIKTQYFVDVHPPLAKLLITLFAFVGGFDGQFDFKDIAKVYENTPYVAMRMLPASLGVALVPLSYLTLRALDCRSVTALFGALLITFENGLITQSRHILLDSPLVFFTALTAFFWIGFSNEDKQRPFTRPWWAWLMLTGLSLGAVLSCKWVGLFTMATIGLSVLRQLWYLLGDKHVTMRMFIRHFMARAWCLIVIPLTFYMLMFAIHFQILQNSGEGDGFMSSEFQHTLSGRAMDDTFADVAYGSTISIRHVNTQGGYLHSHAHLYPSGSKQQQITLYPHRDSNNDFILTKTQDDAAQTWPDEPLEYISNHMHVRLLHPATDKRLHSHDVRAPVSDVDFQNEVSAYGMKDFVGDANDNWVVEIEEGDPSDPESFDRVKTLRTKFRLKHQLQGCYLFSHKVKLPEWGFEQQEVTCNKNAVKANSLWFIETNTNLKLAPDAPKVNYRLPGFFAKFLELQEVMWTTNAGLTDRHAYDSRPDSWPRLRRGINFWVKDNRQIYLLGNPIIWWLSSLAVFTYAAVRGFLILRAQRGYHDFKSTLVTKYDGLCGFLFLGWFMHYFPFFLMSRQLFLHHYFPALYFSILCLCGVFDLVTTTIRPRLRLQIAAVLVVLAIWNFSHFSPLIYGNQWTKTQCFKSKWLKTWDFSCNDFPDDYSWYAGGAPTPQVSNKPVSTIGGEAGGRAAIVVADHEGPPPFGYEAAAQSTIVVDRVQPGHDIFAEAPKKEIKSDSAQQADADAQATSSSEKGDEKVVSAVDPGKVGVAQPVLQGTQSSEDRSETAEDSRGESKQDQVLEQNGDDTVLQQPEPHSEGAVVPPPAPAVGDAAGPMMHDEAEADRVRNELFAEDA